MKLRQYKFKKQLFVLVGNKTKGGALATISDFENGLPSYAHLWPSGQISRYGVGIGTVKDLKFVKWVEIKVNIGESLFNMATNRGWNQKAVSKI